MIESCAFTGHRVIGDDLDFVALHTEIENLILKGVKAFYCGMAVGFDLVAAECVLSLKDKYGVKLFACIPCEGQQKYYSELNQLRYKRILNQCDEQFVLAPSYYNGCMQERDKFMVEKADMVLAYLNKQHGGTYFTVNYAKKLNKQIIYIK
ncbi:MAG: DUF1273 domain-containing protein [Clostridia bacterium]|nr:DUF1273 domain-containing protein [Clostridia bacterium]